MNKIAAISAGNRSQALLSGVPLVESPFFEEALAELEWDEPTRAAARHLREHGWAVIDFPDPEIDAVAERIKQSLHSHYDWNHWRTEGWRNNDGLRIQDAHKFNPDVQRIAANPRVLELLSALYGRRAWPFQTLNFSVGTQQHLHSDSLHFSSVPERFMCGVWVALEDVGPTQGPLVYYSGSHKWPIYVNEHIGYCRAGKWSEPSQEALRGVVGCAHPRRRPGAHVFPRQKGAGVDLGGEFAAWRITSNRSDADPLVAGHSLLFRGLQLLLANVERSFLWPHLLPPASEYRYGGVGAEYVFRPAGSSLIHLAEYRQVGLEA